MGSLVVTMMDGEYGKSRGDHDGRSIWEASWWPWWIVRPKVDDGRDGWSR